MSAERQQPAAGYVRVSTAEAIGTGAQVERHKHTIISQRLDSGLTLTHMIIDLGGRAGRALESVAQWERGAISERTQEAMNEP